MVVCLRGSRSAMPLRQNPNLVCLRREDSPVNLTARIIINQQSNTTQCIYLHQQPITLSKNKMDFSWIKTPQQYLFNFVALSFYHFRAYINCQQQSTDMVGQSCLNDNDCEFLYVCQDGLCVHRNILPPTVYTIFIYLAAGLASSLCNMSGNSMGIFKMLILVIALNYELGEATGLSQAMVVGAALPNVLTIIFKRHPKGYTSLVNYPLIRIIIPSCLLGTVLGAIAETLTPKIAQLAILILVFLYFTVVFFRKLRKLFKTSKTTRKEGKIEDPQRSNQYIIKQTMISSSEGENQEPYSSFKKQRKVAAEKQAKEQQELQSPAKEEKNSIIEYQQSYHGKDILLSLLIFLGFQFLAFLIQGKFSFYQVDKCSPFFALGLVALAVITAGYLHWLRRKFKAKFKKYREYRIQQDIHLDYRRNFYKMALGALAAGFIQGTLGLGGGTCIMAVLLSYCLDYTVASATSGYQILFTGSSSLLQFIINGEVGIFESLWYLGICLIIGGCATLALSYLISKLDKIAVNKFLMGVILLLCLMSIFLTIPTALRIYDADGWQGLTKIKFHCS